MGRGIREKGKGGAIARSGFAMAERSTLVDGVRHQFLALGLIWAYVMQEAIRDSRTRAGYGPARPFCGGRRGAAGRWRLLLRFATEWDFAAAAGWPAATC